MTSSFSPSYRWLFWFLAVLGLCLDLGSKYAVFAVLYHEPVVSAAGYTVPARGGRHELIPGAFALTADYTEQKDTGGDWLSPLRTISSDYLPHINRGALFGVGNGADGSGHYNTWFTTVSLLAAVGIIFWALSSGSRDRWLSVALGLILAGTLGNLYDRVVFGGVRDFLHWYYVVNWPVFNIADCCLVCGASLLLIQAFFLQSQATDQPAAQTAEVAEVR